MAQVNTMGLVAGSRLCSSQAVSSSVSVPCVITTARVSASSSACVQARSNARHTGQSISLLSTCAICCVCTGPSACCSRSGTASSSDCTVICPALYPTPCDCESARPAMVPPVPRITNFDCPTCTSWKTG